MPPTQRERVGNTLSTAETKLLTDEDIIEFFSEKPDDILIELEKHLDATTDDEKRYQICVQYREAQVQALHDNSISIVKCHDEMAKKCKKYQGISTAKRQKTSSYATTQSRSESEAWQPFEERRKMAMKDLRKCIVDLQSVEDAWGSSIVKHYGWRLKPRSFCYGLKRAAAAVPEWSYATIKLNQLRHDRMLRLNSTEPSENIDMVDLNHLAKWKDDSPFSIRGGGGKEDRELPNQSLSTIENPQRYKFDKYGLLVRGETSDKADSNSIQPVLRSSVRGDNRPDYTQACAPKPRQTSHTMALRRRADNPDETNGCVSNDTPASEPNLTGKHNASNRLIGNGGDELETDSTPSGDENSTVILPHSPTFDEEIAPDPSRALTLSKRVTEYKQYRQLILEQLRKKLSNVSELRPKTWGNQTDFSTLKFLDLSSVPNSDTRMGRVEVHFCHSEAEASDLVESAAFDGPIVVKTQERCVWQRDRSYIKQLFDHFGNLRRKISVQIPSRTLGSKSFDQKSLRQVRDRFCEQVNPSEDPWNVLDSDNPVAIDQTPGFLGGFNCALLTCIRNETLNASSASRRNPNAREEARWKNVSNWLLMAQGGNNTGPHTDSNGFATWITVKQGPVGFGWYSTPDPKDIVCDKNPNQLLRDRWRFVVLEDGETIFFDSGTTHFVFRDRTLLTTISMAGHILLFSSLTRWLKTVHIQVANDECTNEEVTFDSVSSYLQPALNIVRDKLEDDVPLPGGREAAERFIEMAKKFMATKGKSLD